MKPEYDAVVNARVEERKLAVIGDLQADLRNVIHTPVYHKFLQAFTVSEADKLDNKAAAASERDQELRLNLINQYIFMTSKEMASADSDEEVAEEDD